MATLLQRLVSIKARVRPGVLFMLMVVAGLAIFALVASVREYAVDPSLQKANASDPVSYTITLESFDVDTGLVQATTTVRPEVLKRLKSVAPKLDPKGRVLPHDSLDLAWENIKLGYSNLELTDEGRNLFNNGSQFGLLSLVIQEYNAEARRVIDEMDGDRTFQRDWLSGAQEKSGYLVSIGSPTLFPFDRYLLIGRTGADAYAGVLGGKAIRLPGNTYSINSRVSGFVVHKASIEEVKNWVGGGANQFPGQSQSEIRKELDRQLPTLLGGNENYFALIIERPSFVRSLAILLAVLACISVVFVVVTSEPKQFFVSAVGSFLALWTVRNVLSAGAPKTQTLVDYGTLILFLLQFFGMLLKASFRRSPDIPGA